MPGGVLAGGLIRLVAEKDWGELAEKIDGEPSSISGSDAVGRALLNHLDRAPNSAGDAAGRDSLRTEADAWVTDLLIDRSGRIRGARVYLAREGRWLGVGAGATLIAAGTPTTDAVLAGMIEPLTDDTDVKAALLDVARAVVG